MQRRPSDESGRRLLRLDDVESSVALDQEGSARRRREARAARAAARRRRRFRRTVIVSVLIAMVVVSGTVYAVTHRASAPVASDQTNHGSTGRASADATSPDATTTPTAEASSAAASTKPAPDRTASASTARSSDPSAKPTSSEAKSITVSVWNGARLKGVAHSVGAELQQDGYDVVQETNADNSDYRQTLIVLKDKDAVPAADTVRGFLSIGKIEVTGRYQFSSDVLVIVGKDWPTR